MQKLSSALALSFALVLAGCASSPRDSSSSAPAPSASTSAPAPSSAATTRISTPVSIPAASAKKVVMTMTGSKIAMDSKDWTELKREFRETFADNAKASGVAFSFVDTAPAAGAEDAIVLTVNVSDYRIVGVGARIFFGIMTGNAFIDAQVSYSDLKTSAKFGEQQYNTRSSAWGGIFAQMTPAQVNQIAVSVFGELKAAK